MLLDTRHCRKCAFTNVAHVDPNIESIFECNNLRFSPDMFCHISVIKDDCCCCFFLPEHLCECWDKPKVDAESPALFTADAATILVGMRSFAGIFHI